MITLEQIQQNYKLLAPKIVNFLAAQGLAHDVASDITQDTFVKIWQRRDEYSCDDNLSGLAFQIARNLRIDYIRKNSKMVVVDNLDNDDEATTIVYENKFDDDSEYLRSCINKALDELKPELREAYTMFVIGEQSVKDIAAALDISESLVKVRVHRAKEKLSESLQYLKDQGSI